MTRNNLVFAVAAALGLALDQLTKSWVRGNVNVLTDEIPIIPKVLSIVHAQNTGAAFSLMDGQMALFLVTTIVGVGLVLSFQWSLKEQPGAAFTSGVLGAILGGILGNGVDRLLLGHVTDMVKCYWGFEPGRSWMIDTFGTNVYPIWNVADALLVVGIIVFLVGQAFQREEEPLIVEDEASSGAGG